MRKLFIYIFFLPLFYSCNEKEEAFLVYGFLQEELDEQNFILKEQISKTIIEYELTDDETVVIYDSLTKQFLMDLEEVHMELNENISQDELFDNRAVNDYFFVDNNYTKKGQKYLSQINTYRSSIQKLVGNKTLEKRITLALNTSNRKNRKNHEFGYLQWYYKDMSLISVRAYMKNMEKNVLEIENDFLKNKIIDKITTKGQFMQ